MNDQLKWDKRWLEVAALVGSWSKDPSTKVGAILVYNNRMQAAGYNGFPKNHSDLPEFYLDRQYKYKHIVHAEINALEQIHINAISGFTLYTSFPCCPDCVLAASRRGILRLVCSPIDTTGKTADWIAEWNERIELSKLRAYKLGMTLEIIDV